MKSYGFKNIEEAKNFGDSATHEEYQSLKHAIIESHAALTHLEGLVHAGNNLIKRMNIMANIQMLRIASNAYSQHQHELI